jgi:hypothetical protein
MLFLPSGEVTTEQMEDVKAAILHSLGIREKERPKNDYCYLLRVLVEAQL